MTQGAAAGLIFLLIIALLSIIAIPTPRGIAWDSSSPGGRVVIVLIAVLSLALVMIGVS
jgi:hypothetical protein